MSRKRITLVKMWRKRIALVKMQSANDTAQNTGNVTSHLASRAECTCDKNVIVCHKRTQRTRRRANLLYVSTAESRENLTTIYYYQIEFVRTNFSTYFEINDGQIQVVCNRSFAIGPTGADDWATPTTRIGQLGHSNH
jgi:hypothetical protein